MWWWAFCTSKASSRWRDVRALLDELKRKGKRIDYYCWDLYARTSQWYEQGSDEEKQARKKLRYATLHEIEHGGNETAEVAELISTAVLRRHLETMLRLDIEYDFLPRESEILHLKFWDAAFEQLKQTGVLYFENEGKNKGCWVMTRPGAEVTTRAILDEDAKVIVRSNGTVTYVGKDIAYHLWKFGLLGKDFGYKPFFTYPDHECWISAETRRGRTSALWRSAGHLQRHRRAADRPAGQCDSGPARHGSHRSGRHHYTHFSYEMVALTPRCAIELGYEVCTEDLGSPLHRSQRPQGFRRQGRRPDRQADRRHAAPRWMRARPARSEAERAADREADRHRRAALLHAQVHAQLGHRFRLQGCAEL